MLDWLEGEGVNVDTEGGGLFTVMTDHGKTAREVVQMANNLRVRKRPRLRSFIVEDL